MGHGAPAFPLPLRCAKPRRRHCGDRVHAFAPDLIASLSLAVVYEEPRGLMTRAMIRNQTKLAIEKANGQADTLAAGRSLRPRP